VTGVIVVGGGISGLTVAHALVARAAKDGVPLDLTVLEASSRIGGNIATERFDGYLVESGPDAFVITRPQALDLCHELGLSGRLIETRPENRRVYVVRRGELVRMPEGLVLGVPSRFRAFLRSPLLSPAGKVRALREWLGQRPAGGGEDVTLADFLTDRFGPEMLDVVLEPLLGGIYAGDTRRLSLRSTFPEWFAQHQSGASLMRRARRERKPAGHRAPSPFRSLIGGMAELTDALANAIGRERIRLSTAVSAVERVGPRLRVLIPGGSLEASHVVIALPAHAAARLLSAVEGELASELGQIEYVSTSTVCFAFAREQVRHPLDASGFLVPKSERRNITAATFISSKWQRRAPDGVALIRAFVGGAHAEPLASLPEDELCAMAAADLGALLGISGEPRFAKVFRYLKASPQPGVGHAARRGRIEARVAAIPGLHVIGNAYDGVGIPDSVRLAKRAAERIAGHQD
jgi:oxygen-dependent protoporphyrinogen oxidase